MKKLVSISIIFCFILPLYGQSYVRNTSVTGICYAGKNINRVYIPPPSAFFKKGRATGGASITVYYTGFTTQAKNAMDYAVGILESVLPQDTKFSIAATWEKITTAGVLAHSSITAFIGGYSINAREPLSYYPIALAEKIGGNALNDQLLGDISLSVNSSVNWYYGTDGNPANKYDLVTVILHEICHGLGFFDSYSIQGTTGFYGIGSIPMIYDTFVENSSGNRLTDTLRFLNNSDDLKTILTGNQIYFNGPLLKKYTTASNYLLQKAKLYAPSVFDEGSSISHLDEQLPVINGVAQQRDGLMTPFISMGEAIHDPGKYTMSILGDIGWINTRIFHNQTGDTERHLNNILLSAVINSDTTYNHDRVGVVYSHDNFLTSDSLFLSPDYTGNTYTTTLEIPYYNFDLQYYFFAEDVFKRLYRSPSMYKDSPHLKNSRYHVYIGTDTVKPVIQHTPVSYYLQTADSLKFDATVTDNLGLGSVSVEYSVNNGQPSFINLHRGSTGSYRNGLNAKMLQLKGHDSIKYRFIATDTARIPNIRIKPGTGYFVTGIEEISSTLPSYTTDFSGSSSDFFNIGFQVTKPEGFTKYGLHSKHPYESPEDNNKTINYTSILRHPLKFNESGILINYNELVLIEPGESGSVFGSSSFYDYVIPEGSRDFGKTWFSLTDGYDSRLYDSWESAYNTNIVGNNSVFIGTEAMMKNHTFLCKPSDKIATGDTLLLRFRLFSDPFANGWGWAIEDLKITPLVDAVAKVEAKKINIYPNPGNGLIRISSDLNVSQNKVTCKIFNSSGICVLNNQLSELSGNSLDLSGYPAGIYIILFYTDTGIVSFKYTLVK